MSTSSYSKLDETVFVESSPDNEKTHALRTYDFDVDAKRVTKFDSQTKKVISCCITFCLPNSKNPIIVENNPAFLVGRRDVKNKFAPDVDLTTFHAKRLGVSRVHASIVYEDMQFFIKDLNSTNGTWVNYLKLEPQHVFPLKMGDIIRLGHLTMRVG
jgi:hypothetical protein